MRRTKVPAARSAYELTMLSLAAAAVGLVWVETPWAELAHWAIWAAFVADYAVRLGRVPDRWHFVRSNVPDLVAILPFDHVFRAARLIRLVRLLRLGVIAARYARPLTGVLQTNGLDRVLVVASGAVIVGAAGVQAAEPGIETFGDALWWSLVTVTTVGYGDLSPATGWGRSIAVVLMLTGIGTLGMLTGSIATFFLSDRGARNTANAHVRHVQEQLERFDTLSPDDLDMVIAILQQLRQQKAEAEASEARAGDVRSNALSEVR
ncbi:MAG: potassium channel family protein [Chloroflexi bacterium]|nr:potassium channel family protein [Chloroflexota bacterium]